MSLSTKLHQLRKDKDLTLEDAARLLGVSDSSISRLEDDQSPRVAALTVSRLARAYQADVLELYEAAGRYIKPMEIPLERPDPSEQE